MFVLLVNLQILYKFPFLVTKHNIYLQQSVIQIISVVLTAKDPSNPVLSYSYQNYRYVFF